MKAKQTGYVNLDGVLKAFIALGVICAFLGVILWYLLGYIWILIKPLLHSLTA
jgi:hypothetical protein